MEFQTYVNNNGQLATTVRYKDRIFEIVYHGAAENHDTAGKKFLTEDDLHFKYN